MIARDPDLEGALSLTVDEFQLSPIGEADAADLFAHLADPRVVEFMDIDPLTALDQADAIIAWALGLRGVGAGVRWTIRAGSGDFVGTCGFNRLVLERGRRGEIAYDLGPAWWGRGVMARILPVLVAFGFERLSLHRLEAMVTPGNARSCRLLERHGFQRDGVLPGYGHWKGRYWDQILYSRVASGPPIH
jgi:ribosomal-protein-alanine N-acetyltransferase